MEQSTITTFAELGIEPTTFAILDGLGVRTPTPIQRSAIPDALAGSDLIGIAQTGTGKTYAFGLPMLQQIATKGGRGLIVLPTRELALQVEQALKPVADALKIGLAVFIGGAPMDVQRRMLKRDPKVLIATPGRLLDHIERRTISLKQVAYLVLDEADRMLDMGFMPQVKRILSEVPKERQTMLFSATMPSEIVMIATAHMKMPIRVEVAPQGTTAERIMQGMVIVHREAKNDMLKQLLAEYKGSVLVFTRTKYGAKKLTHVLSQMGQTAAEIHGNRSLPQRRAALDGFKSGRNRVLVATDIAARGIDVEGIELVVNYDLPADPEDYVHRIGRTGRAGREGHAISLATPDQRDEIRRIERLIRTSIPVLEMEGSTTLSASAAPKTRHFGGHRRSRVSGRGRR